MREARRTRSAISSALSVYNQRKRAYPEIRGTSIEVQEDGLRRRTDGDLTEVHGVVLLILCGDVAGLTRSGILLGQNTTVLSLASKLMEETVSTSLLDLVHLKVWSRLGGLKSPLVEEVDITLQTRFLILAVGTDLDSLQSLKSRHLGRAVG